MSARAARGGPAPVVLPVGGGKGGIGKSVVAANLGLALARLEKSVTLVDADLGGADLHNLLGLAGDMAGLGEVLTDRDLEVAGVHHQVLEPRLFFVPGDAMAVATANPSFQKKRKLLHAIKRLPSQFILLDLGAGTAITVMDFFLTSPLSLLVMLPERPARLSAANFLKNAVYRVLDRLFRDNTGTGKALEEFRAGARGPGAMGIAELIEALERAQPGAGNKARRALERWRPKLILNRVRLVDDFIHARQLQQWAAQELGLAVEILGFLPEDDVVRAAAARETPVLDHDPRAPFCRALALVAMDIAAWADRAAQWAVTPPARDSFEAAATRFAELFPPPGTAVPTRDELLSRLRQLEARPTI